MLADLCKALSDPDMGGPGTPVDEK